MFGNSRLRPTISEQYEFSSFYLKTHDECDRNKWYVTCDSARWHYYATRKEKGRFMQSF